MSKKIKSFDLFSDEEINEEEELDIYDDESEEHDDTDSEDDVEEDDNTDSEDDVEEDDESEEDYDDDSDDDDDDDDDDESDFSYDDFDAIAEEIKKEKETKNKKSKTSSKKSSKKKKSIAPLIIAWVLFLGLAVAFGVVMFKKSKKNDEETSTTKFTYQTNANININALISDYYNAIVICNQDELKSMVTNPAAFDDMTQYEQLSKIRNAYTNINCYSVEGYSKNDTIVYVTSNVSIIGISSKPMDIQTFYIVQDNPGHYIIDNSEKSAEVKEYMDKVQADKDIQELYMAVMANIEDCKKNDPAFAELWNKLYGY